VTAPNPSTALARVVLDELASCGVEVVVLSPGSRSAALAIAAAAHPDLETRVVIDERSAAFHALGVGKATRRPAAVIATSGTAPANHFPAVVEADMACIPLFVISADRPVELRGVGANQTIDQMDLFGAKVRAFAAIEASDAATDGNESWRHTVRGLVVEATGRRPGPVHLNVAFREPTVPVGDDGRAHSEPYPHATPRIGNPVTATDPPGLPLPVLAAPRGLIIAGDGEYDRVALLAAAGAVGWPVLATALSGMRGGGALGDYHQLLASGLPEQLAPETVVAVGAIGPSPRLEDLVAKASHRVRVDVWGRHIDPQRNATQILSGDPVTLIRSVAGAEEKAWLQAWVAAEEESGRLRRAVLAEGTAMTGGSVAASCNEIDWGALVVGSSLPIREVETHVQKPGPVFANRGASGIDGFVSTALGVASVMPRTLAVAGDLTFLHDGNGLVVDTEIDLTAIVIDNHGGGLFDNLPQRRHAPDFERLFITPSRRDMAALARFHGARVETVDRPGALVPAVEAGLARGGVDVIVAAVDREVDLALRRQLGG
jgi:2-succinyl-5-enolpyruvyl-6-hydroxy-3-cyclohexene-1-carboxylate synthase